MSIDFLGKSSLSVTQLNSIVAGTGLANLGQAFHDAEQEFNINALFLLAKAAVESSWGKSTLAVTKNTLYGLNSYATKYDAVLDYAKHLSQNEGYEISPQVVSIMKYEVSKLINKEV